MRVVIQRVKSAKVEVDGKTISEIGEGLLTLLGIKKGDSLEDLQKVIQKVVSLRIFEDDQGKMNRSLLDIAGEHLIVSQFTLVGDCHSGKRPSFTDAENPERAKALYEKALSISESLGVKTQGGQFQANMQVSLINDGPVTFLLES